MGLALLGKQSDYKILDEYLKFSLFADVELGLAAAQKIDEAMDEALDKIGEMLFPLNWSLILNDSEREVLYFKKSRGKSGEQLEGKDLPKRKGLANWVFENAKPLVVKDVQKEPRFHNYIDKLSGFKARTALGVPLVLNGDVIGVIELINKKDKGRFTNSDLKILQTITDYAVLAVEKIYYLGAVENISTIDPLTGLLNPKYLNKIIEREIERCQRYGQPLTVMILAVENLNFINKKHGYSTGDRVLRNIADILKKNIRKIDSVSRYKGNKFLILMPNTKNHEAENVRQRVIKLTKKKIKLKKKQEISCSSNIELKSVGPENASELLKMIPQS
ncbi:MAG: diguanylate cyclase [Acidobacteriota bacterium]